MRGSGDFCDDDEMSDVAGGAQQRVFAHEAEVGISPGLGRVRLRMGRDLGGEELACEGEAPRLDPIGEESEMSDANESHRHMSNLIMHAFFTTKD